MISKPDFYNTASLKIDNSENPSASDPQIPGFTAVPGVGPRDGWSVKASPGVPMHTVRTTVRGLSACPGGTRVMSELQGVPEICRNCWHHVHPHVPFLGRDSGILDSQMVKNSRSEQQCSWHAVPGSGHGCKASGQVGASGEQEGWDDMASDVPATEGSRRNSALDHEALVK